MLCNESSLTGETEGVRKEALDEKNMDENPNPFLLQSSIAETGEGKAVVCVVGERTRVGRSQRMLDFEDDQTPLQLKLESVAETIGYMGLAFAVLTFLALVAQMLVLVFYYHEREFVDIKNLNEVINAFIIAITVIVVAIPEGLPLAVTISLAFSVHKMYEKKNLVRRLHASETMGGATEICTDKTGTLTLNKMQVTKLYFNDRVQDKSEILNERSSLLFESVIFNCSAHTEESTDGEKLVKGNPTEVGLINYLTKQGSVEGYFE